MSLSLTAWLTRATPDQARKLAKLAKTSVKSLRHISAGRRSGSAAAAIAIYEASRHCGLQHKDGSDAVVTLWSVCPALRKLEPYLKLPR